MRVVAYARYSSDQQRAASIDDQVRNCRRRAEAECWTISHVYADKAITGADSSRPQYQKMLSAADHGEFDVLLVDDLSRLARDQVENERAIRRLEFRGIRIIATTDGYDSQTKVATRKIQRTVKGLVNEMRLDELREQVHRGQAGQAEKGYWCGGRAYGFRLRPILDSACTDAYGQPERIGTKLEIDPAQAEVVKDMFQRYIEGASYLTIAKDLNARGVPSAGSRWKRKVRRCNGWTASAVRVILRNPLYTGRVRWNASQFVRNPDTGSYKRLKRPQSDWYEHQDERLRIVTDEVFEQARFRTFMRGNSDQRLKSGYRPKFLLSGLLLCPCGAHFVMADARAYVCGGRREGACKSTIRVRRDALEAAIYEPIKNLLLAPEQAERMAKRLQLDYARRINDAQDRAVTLPAELVELDARIARLRTRLDKGDPDMARDEIEAAIARAEGKRRELAAPLTLPTAKAGARLLALLPDAARRYREQIEGGLEGKPEQMAKARVLLRELVGPVHLKVDPEDGGVYANFDLHPAALIQRAGTGGRGEGICTVPALPVRVRVK